jgi:8-oxo-dGTP diphosphatase
MEKEKPYCYEYPRPAVSVDMVIVTREPRPRVLLIRRKNDPFVGMWALPGGFVDMDETLDAAAARELREETGVTAERLVQLHTFGDPGRDPRGRVITVAYLAEVDPTKLQPIAADDAAEVGWHDLQAPPALAFDHDKILACACERLQRDKNSANAARP